MQRLVFLFCAALAAFLMFRAGQAPEALEPLVIRGGDALHRYEVEIAGTPGAWKTGLMYRTHLAPGRGMLFLLQEERPVQMWMKNTYVPLDMLFIDRRGTVLRVVADTTPLSEEHIPSVHPVHAVLELPAGSVEKAGIGVGDTVEHPAFAP